MKRGSDWSWTIKLRENDGVTPKDTTNWALTLTIKSASNGDVYDTLIIGDGITNTPASGQLNIDRPYSTINGYKFTTAIYDLIYVDASANHRCIFYGNDRIIP